jgi:hypothetical protein
MTVKEMKALIMLGKYEINVPLTMSSARLVTAKDLWFPIHY